MVNKDFFFPSCLPKTALRLLFSSVPIVTWKRSLVHLMYTTQTDEDLWLYRRIVVFFFLHLHKCYANNWPRWAEAPALLPVFLNTLMFWEMNGVPVFWFNPFVDLSLWFPVHVANRCCWADLKSNIAFNTLTPVLTAQVNLCQVDKSFLNGILTPVCH